MFRISNLIAAVADKKFVVILLKTVIKIFEKVKEEAKIGCSRTRRMHKTGGKPEPTRKMVCFYFILHITYCSINYAYPTFILSISSLLKDKYNGKKFEEKVKTINSLQKSIYVYVKYL